MTTHVSPEELRLIRRAAAVSGLSVDRFLAETAREQAAATLREHEVLVLTSEDRQALFDALREPPEPSKRMRQAALRYRELVGDQ